METEEIESEGAEAGQPVGMETGSGVGTASPEVKRDHCYCKVRVKVKTAS